MTTYDDNDVGFIRRQSSASRLGTSRTTDLTRFTGSGGGPLGSFKKGGKVKKTGIYKLHKGERVTRAKR